MDKTWCTQSTCKNFGNGCDRSLTDEVKNELTHGGEEKVHQFIFSILMKNPNALLKMNFCLRRLTVRTPGFHPGNGSSILPGDATFGSIVKRI